MGRRDKFYAIIGDIVSSRSLSDRSEVQKKLKGVLEWVNSEFRSSIAANFLITLGDEFQGLLCERCEDSPIRIAFEIRRLMHPVKIRISIGCGELSTEVDPLFAIGADGEAFYIAREGIESLRSMEKHGGYAVKGGIVVGTGSGKWDKYLNEILSLSNTLEEGWTERQREIAAEHTRICLANEKKTQLDLAGEFGISQGSLSKSLTVSRAREYARGLLVASEMLKTICLMEDTE